MTQSRLISMSDYRRCQSVSIALGLVRIWLIVMSCVVVISMLPSLLAKRWLGGGIYLQGWLSLDPAQNTWSVQDWHGPGWRRLVLSADVEYQSIETTQKPANVWATGIGRRLEDQTGAALLPGNSRLNREDLSLPPNIVTLFRNEEVVIEAWSGFGIPLFHGVVVIEGSLARGRKSPIREAGVMEIGQTGAAAAQPGMSLLVYGVSIPGLMFWSAVSAVLTVFMHVCVAKYRTIRALHRELQGRCRKCGYVFGSESIAICPECGSARLKSRFV